MTSVEEILSEIEKRTNLSKEDLKEKLNKKQKDLSGLVSLEGAAHLVAKELGVNLLEKEKRKLEMKNIVSGMRNVNIVGRVFKISNINEFKRSDGSSGKVANLSVGDATDHVRLALWNDQTKLVENGEIKLGNPIQIVNGFAKENVFGGIEIALGKYGSIKPVEDVFDLPSLNELTKKFLSNTLAKTSISAIASGQVDVDATIVHVFGSNFIFNTCPSCNATVEKKGEKFICREHKEVKPENALVISAIADDGTANTRVVFFRDTAEKLLGITANDLAGMDREKRFELVKKKILGSEIQLLGRVKKNKIFNSLELIVNDFRRLNVLEKSKKLIDEIELKVGG